ncbi:hypothetical protein PVAG01_01242 [Phlyctema vagabunda]|uniref:FAD-binding domain-containing protein n=1 Tax=Phlyctema vagabunda TaxID=108571 RepID=A0ABR4PX11_9HELO
MAQQPIVIIGAGLGGLTLGRCLRHYGIPSILYEKMPLVARHGYAITLHASTYKPLLRVLDMDEATFKRRVAVDGADGVISPRLLVYDRALLQPSSFRVHRGKLEDLLREGLDVYPEHALDKVDETPEGRPLLRLQNGETLSSNCVVGVDGVHSSLRNSMLPRTAFNMLPFVAFNGKRQVQRTLFDSIYAPVMKGTNVVEFKANGTVLNISVNEQTPEQVSISWIYSRPARGAIDPLYRPTRALSAATDIPEEFYEEISTLADLPEPFKEVFDREKLKSERVLHWLMRSVLVSLAELQELGKKGVFLIGDSVHAEPIIGGQGANVAISDGVGLAERISKNGPGGVHEWYATQYSSWDQGVKDSERAIAEIHADHGPML